MTIQYRTGTAVTESYDAVWQWSVADLDVFWRAIWDYCEVHTDGLTGPSKPRCPEESGVRTEEDR